MKKFLKKKEYFYIGVFVMILFIVCYAFYNFNYSKDYNLLKLDSSKHLIYTLSQTQYDNYYQYTPYVNLRGEVGEIVNEDIQSFLSSFQKDNICITYESDLSGKVLSLVLKVEDHSYAESATIYYFRSYNINLDTQELLPDEVLFSYFELTKEDVEHFMNSRIEEHYYQLIQEGVFDSRNCNYDCFLESRDFSEGIEDASYFVRDGKLVVFKPYTNISFSSQSGDIYDFEITE